MDDNGIVDNTHYDVVVEIILIFVLGMTNNVSYLNFLIFHDANNKRPPDDFLEAFVGG